jgi:hypothetical protein
MKQILTTMLLGAAMMFAGNVHAQFTVANDIAANYSGTWGNSNNFGYGFEAWDISYGADTGTFTGSPANNGMGTTGIGTTAFGMFATGGAYLNARRPFRNPMNVGDKLTFYWAINWDANGGAKGFDLKSGSSTVVFNVNNAANAAIGSSNGEIDANYGTNPMLVTLTRTSSSQYSFEMTRRSDGSTYSTTINSSLAVDRLEFYIGNQNDGDGNRNMYANVLEITSESASTSISNSIGFRLMSAPSSTTFGTLLGPVWTQGILNSDSPSNGTANVWTWNNSSTDAANTNWTALSNMGNTIAAGSGFLYYHFNDDNYDGTLNAGATALSVTGAENTAPTITVNSNTDMYTLVGNPFATAISWNSLTKTNLYANAQVHHPTSGWQEVTSESPLIAPFQAVFVRTSASSPTLGITTAAKASGGTFVGKAVVPNIVSIQANSAEMSDLNRLVFSNDASLGHDWMDTERLAQLNQHYLMLPMVGADNRLYSTISLPELTESVEIPISVEFTQTGEVELLIREYNPPQGYNIQIKDTYTGETLGIDENFSYTFNHVSAAKVRSTEEIIAEFGVLTTSSESRFKLVITPPNATSTEIGNDLPASVTLSQNFPNPFNPTTSIRFELPERTEVRLAVYDLTGREVATLANGAFAPGSHSVNFSAAELSSGVYVYRLDAAGQTHTRKMTLIK